MRSEDFNLATQLRDQWRHGKTEVPAGTCMLIGNPDALLDFLEANSIRPGDAIDHCPACGEMHRWTLLRMLLEFVVAAKPSCSGALADWTRARLEEEYAEYGGREGYQAFCSKAEDYFKRIGAKDVYRP